jgi:hypothetical protein
MECIQLRMVASDDGKWMFVSTRLRLTYKLYVHIHKKFSPLIFGLFYFSGILVVNFTNLLVQRTVFWYTAQTNT